MEFSQHFLGGLLEAINSDGLARFDAGEVAFVAKDLEYVMATTYDIEYPELKALQILPVNTEVDPGAEEYSYVQWDIVGKAQFISDYATDFPMVEAFLKRFVFAIAGIGIGYQYTVQDMRKAAMRRLSKGKSLDVARAATAALVHAQFVDQVAAYGDTARGLTGLITNTDIPLVTGLSGSWDLKTTGSDAENAAIALDLTAIALTPEINTVQRHVADTLLLPLSQKKRLYAPTSTYIKQPLILNWLLNQENIKQVIWWNKLDSAYSSGALSANQAWVMALKQDPSVVYYVIPLQFTQHAPQQVGLAFKVPCESRTGGVCMPYPLAACRVNVHS